MQQIAEQQRRWRENGRFRKLHASLNLENDGLVLGAKTVLAKRAGDGTLEIEGKETKLLTLLAVAYGRPVDRSVLGAITRASKYAHAGNECLASMHIALAGLPRLPDPPEAARRLFIADGLIEDGVDPRDIWTALEFDPALLDDPKVEKGYDPAEPRVPAGSGRPSGRWTNEGAIASAVAAIAAAEGSAQWAAEEAARAIGARAAEAVGAGLRVASRVALPAAVLNDLFNSPELGGSRIVGSVRDFSDLNYSRHSDETALHIVRTSTGRPVLTLYPSGRGTFVDPQSGVVAHMEGDDLVIGPPAAAVPRVREATDDPDECPGPPAPDKLGMIGERGERSKAYEDYMKQFVNPEDPTPHGYGYQLPDPAQGGKLVYYDDCHHLTGTMLEYKGPGFAELLAEKSPVFRFSFTEDWTKQAERQVSASEGRPVTWVFAEEPALEFARAIFKNDKALSRITLLYGPWPDGDRWKWTKSIICSIDGRMPALRGNDILLRKSGILSIDPLRIFAQQRPTTQSERT